MDTGTILQLSIPGCKLTCNKIKSELATCTNTKGNRMVTNSLYFIFRMLATMCLACNFVLLHAQTIQMCKIEEEQGNTGALGRQYVYEALAQAIISPSGTTKVKKIVKGSLDSISSPSPSLKIQIMGGKVCLKGKGKTLQDIVNKLFVIKSLLTTRGNVFAFTPFSPMI